MTSSVLADLKAICNTDIEALLYLAVDRGASDLHLTVPYPPSLRINGTIIPLDDMPEVMPDDVTRVFEAITTEDQRETFYQKLELDFVCNIPDLARSSFW